MPEALSLTRHKVGDQKYELRLPSGETVAVAVKTGTHLDDYPWDTYTLGGWDTARYPGAQDSLRACVDFMKHNAHRKES